MSVIALKSAFDLLKHHKLVASTDDGEYFIEPNSRKTSVVDMSYMLERRRRDEARLQRMIEYSERTNCRRAYVIEYFGQKLERACDACDRCRPEAPERPPFPLPKQWAQK